MSDEANETVVETDNRVRFTSHPIENFRVGRFRFTRGQLALSPEDAAEFEELLESLPTVERMRVRKIDLAAAERISQEFLASQARTTKQIDSSTGERAKPVVGTGKLGDDSTEAFATQAQMDMNRPVDAEKVDKPLAGTETNGESNMEAKYEKEPPKGLPAGLGKSNKK